METMKLLLQVAAIFLLFSCSDKLNETKNLETLLKRSNISELDRFLVVYKVVSIYLLNHKYIDSLNVINFAILNSKKKDYLPLYYYLMGNAYNAMGEEQVAFIYYKYFFQNFNDYIYEGKSIKSDIARRIINLNIDPKDKIYYYEYILEKDIDFLTNERKGKIYYDLALSLESVQNYSLAYFYYKKLLSLPRFELRIDSKDYSNVITKVNYYDNPDFVVYKNLNDLIKDVKKYVISGDISKLLSIKNKNNFFIQSWDQKSGKGNSINTNSFLSTMVGIASKSKKGIQFSSTLEPDSSNDTSYLESIGWAHIDEWYFVFKKISYPEDPEINNGWAWVGMYLGKK